LPAQLQEVEGDEYRGIVKVSRSRRSTGRTFVEKDDVNHRAVLKADGRDTRGRATLRRSSRRSYNRSVIAPRFLSAPISP
jgi:hypothetical protein